MLPEQLKEMSDTIEFIDSQLDRLSSKLPTYDKSIDASVTQLIENAETMQRELLSGPDIDSSSDLSVMAVMLWEKVVEQVKKLSNQTIGDHRELHSLISKCGREIEKSFFSGYNGLCQKILDYENDANLSRCVNALTMQHLLLRGLFEGARKFAEECNIPLEDDTRRLYTETEIVHNALKQRNLDPALEWCRIHSEKLQEMGSSLEFNLHKLKFIELINRGVYEQLEALSH
uniref:CTLH domain-containing protein n=1 Tax=Romanomermis culicivorax TaxID=13658 RepID=A0A915KH08_ROMCU